MMAKGHFEAKKHAFRQTQDGVVVSFVIHPNDMPAELAIAPLGTIYMIGFAAIGEPEGGAQRPATVRAAEKKDADKASAALSPKPKQRWDQLRPSARAALLTKDPQFWEYLADYTAGGWAEFPSAGKQGNAPDFMERCADNFLKSDFGIKSKAELDTSQFLANKLQGIEGNFRAWQQAKGHQAA